MNASDLRTLVLSAALTITLGLLLVDTVIVHRNTNHIKALQQQIDRRSRRRDLQQQADIASIRQLDYRLCVRINDTRGIQILDLHQDHANTRLVADLPMYECDRTIQDGVRLMTASEQAAYLRLLVTGKNPGP
jgi:hypothetical protein